jgi:hypothetical protein
MATLGELKTRIITETDRDDLGAGEEAEDALVLCINQAIEYYSDEPFWFMHDSGSSSTTSGVAWVNTPAAVRVPETVSYNGVPLQKVTVGAIEFLTDSGQPSLWAEAGDIIQLWPIPDATYSLDVFGSAQIDAPTSDSDITVWTVEAYDLIAARTRFLLYRDVFRDVEGVQFAGQAEAEALSRLRRETRRRTVTPLRSNGDEPWAAAGTFNINRGY